jgi:hypothetical protein
METEPIVNIEEAAAFIDIPNFRKLSNGLSLCPNKRMEGPLCRFFIEWSNQLYEIPVDETSLKDESDIFGLNFFKKLYQVNVNELIVFACIILTGDCKDFSKDGIALFNSNPTEKSVFIYSNKNIKLEKIIFPLNLQEKKYHLMSKK